MKMLNTMYGWAIILLLALAAMGSYSRGIPIGLIAAVLTACLIDLGMKKLLKKSLKFPYSAFITGLIIGSVAQFNASFEVVILASVFAIASKYLIRLNKSHIFNPAAFGLFVSLLVLSSGDEWWAATASLNIGFTLLLSPILILACYKAGKLWVSLPYLAVMSFLVLVLGVIPLNPTTLLYSLPYYLAFIMVCEPRTSPYPRNQQISFGILAAVLFVGFSMLAIPYYFLTSLLATNLVFGLHGFWLSRKKP